MKNRDLIPELVRELYSVVKKLTELYPDRKFTPDGHLVGSIGEVIAKHDYNLTLLPTSAEIHDAESPDGKLIQIKTTQTNRVALSSQPDYLIVLSLDKIGDVTEIYNGPGEKPWEAAGKKQKNGQRTIYFNRLSEIMKSVKQQDQIPKVAI
jgi:hypothetical protein